MKILIVGEFSGFAKHLKNGFKKLGHEVTIVMQPDSFKKFKGEHDDIVYRSHWFFLGHPIKGTARLPHPLKAYRINKRLNEIYKDSAPDIIVVINYSFLSSSRTMPGTQISFIQRCIKRGSKLIMSECGSTPADCFNHSEFWKERGRKIVLEDKRYSFLLETSNIIIPTIYGYYENLLEYNKYHMFDLDKLNNAIPLPITIDKDVKVDSCVNRKIVVFHGIIRPIDKGTPFITEAMNRLQREYPDKVLCISRGGMPYDEYVKLFNKIDILIDQTYGNGWGMNAIIGAMNGKCVLAPCGQENGENMNIPDIPFIRIGPNSDKIFEVLKDLVLNPHQIDAIRKKSRRFAEKHCECSIIARKYIDLITS